MKTIRRIFNRINRTRFRFVILYVLAIVLKVRSG